MVPSEKLRDLVVLFLDQQVSGVLDHDRLQPTGARHTFLSWRSGKKAYHVLDPRV